MGRSEEESRALAYAIAAYVIVLGSLLAYGLWIQAQRRALLRRARESHRLREPGAPS